MCGYTLFVWYPKSLGLYQETQMQKIHQRDESPMIYSWIGVQWVCEQLWKCVGRITIFHFKKTENDLNSPMKSIITSILLASSKSQSLIVPLAAPAATNTSEESKLTESIPLEWPDKLYTNTWRRPSVNTKYTAMNEIKNQKNGQHPTSGLDNGKCPIMPIQKRKDWTS